MFRITENKISNYICAYPQIFHLLHYFYLKYNRTPIRKKTIPILCIGNTNITLNIAGIITLRY